MVGKRGQQSVTPGAYAYRQGFCEAHCQVCLRCWGILRHNKVGCSLNLKISGIVNPQSPISRMYTYPQSEYTHTQFLPGSCLFKLGALLNMKHQVTTIHEFHDEEQAFLVAIDK